MGVEHRQAMIAACRCGGVTFEVTGAPILGAVCHCTSCQAAAARIAQLPGAPPLLDAHGGTPFLLYRKDRIGGVRGGDQLVEHRLKPDSPTRRMVAGCCNAPMFLEFSKGHWLSVYRDRLPEGAPPLQLRCMTRDRREGVVLPDDLPSYASHSPAFMWKLLTAWAAMGFRAPRVQGVPE